MGILTSLLKDALFFLYPIGHIAIAVAGWFALNWSIKLWKNARTLESAETKATSLATLILPVLLASISYDNFVLGAGRFIGAGDVLENLSMVRFLAHYIIVPFFIAVGVEIAHEAGAKWANKGVRILSWIVAAGLAIADVTVNYVGLVLEPTSFQGVLRYTAANLTAPPVVTIAINVFMVLIAIGVWIRLKWSWLFVGTLIAFLANAIPSDIVGTLPGSLSELLMAFSLLLTEKRIQDQKQPTLDIGIESIDEFEWDYILPKDGYTVYQSGSHIDGDFIQVYVPHTPHRTAEGKLKLISYLHGFALCLPKFYETHLAELAGKQGYYVFFPDFQKSRYPDDPEEANKSIPQDQLEASLTYWFAELRKTLANPKNLIEELKAKRKKILRVIARRLFKPTLAKYARVSLALLVIILVIRVISFVVGRRYGKNLIQLISTVALSLLHSPKEWGNQAIDLTAISWQKLGIDHPELANADFDFYVFGHSLGGLLALSWPFFLQQQERHANQSLHADLERFTPKQVLTADPAPSTELGIPMSVILVLKLFNVPFAEDPVAIKETGASLAHIPVGIMHGASDKIVRPQAWVKPALFAQEANYDYIPTGQKQIYFSQSSPEDNLVAFHNQAVTNTTYFEDALFQKFGGVKESPNAYNYDYVWRGLNLVVQNEKQANQLLTCFTNMDFKVLETFSTGAPWVKRLVIGVGAIALAFLTYWLFSTGTLFT